MESEPKIDAAVGFPELTDLGKRIEMLRIERGISKQHLARFAGTSRQQLWRVMTGKSELTTGLRARLSDVLGVGLDGLAANAPATRSTTNLAAGTNPVSAEVAGYLADATQVERTLRTMPGGDAGRRVKRALLDALEHHAIESGHVLRADFFELRRRVVAGEL